MPRRYNENYKRLFDIIFALFCLILFLPLGLLIAVLIKLESKGPIIFKQKRVGRHGKAYWIYKFRSMRLHDQAPEVLGPIKHSHPLVTKIGYVLRRFKLDEFPQFINVLLGEMSIVGPRPCLISTYESLDTKARRRFSVRPGVSGWAEVNGNVELTWPEQLALDLWYIHHQTFMLDVTIIVKTILTIFVGSIKNNENLLAAKKYLAHD